MSRRGLTLLEVLLSVGLLGALFASTSRWLQVAAAARAEAEGPRRWEEAARALLEGIHDDLWTGDVVAEKGERPVAIEEEGLLVRTRERGRGRATHVYRFDPLEAHVVRADLSAGAAPLVEGVRSFLAEREDRVLSVRIESTDGREMERRYVLP